MSGLVLRTASAGDSQFAYRVKKAAFKEYAAQVWGWDEDEQQALHRRRFHAQDLRVVSLNGEDIGIVAVVRKPDCLKLNQLFLLPDHQGMGIGRECMLRIMTEARQRNLPVRLQVLNVNVRALAFFQKLGFTRTGETDTHILMEGDYDAFHCHRL